MSEVIITSTGKVEKIDGKWMIIPDKNSPDIRFLGFTDRIPYDCAVIRHKSKYGLF